MENPFSEKPSDNQFSEKPSEKQEGENPQDNKEEVKIQVKSFKEDEEEGKEQDKSPQKYKNLDKIDKFVSLEEKYFFNEDPAKDAL